MTKRVRNSFAQSSLVIAALICFTGAAEAQTYKLETTSMAAPQELAAPVRDALSGNALKVSDGKGPYCEIFLRKQIPAVNKPDTSIGVTFGQIAPGTLVGAIKFEDRVTDYRNQQIQAGVYTLRYMLIPVDGNHQGVAPDRDFVLLIPAALDTSAANLPADKAFLDLSRKATGTAHPSVWSMVPAPDPGPANLPAIVHQDDGDLWIVYFSGPLAKPLTMGLVVAGHAPEV
jgi:hypothetical protein